MARTSAKLRTNQGLNRAATAAKVATSTFNATSPTTGDIALGTIAVLDMDGASTTYTVACRTRATGAIEIARDLDKDTGIITVDPTTTDGTLSVTVNNNVIGTITYWVF